MAVMTDYLVPVLLLVTALLALRKKQDVYSILLSGGRDGLRILLTILPGLVMLLSSFHMLRASGALELLTGLLKPAASFAGIPPEVLPLLLIRPISGSAALAIGAELIGTYGPESQIGLSAAIILGSTETTFYTISVYFGAAGIKKTRYAVPAALCADLTSFLSACLCARLLF